MPPKHINQPKTYEIRSKSTGKTIETYRTKNTATAAIGKMQHELKEELEIVKVKRNRFYEGGVK